MSQEDTQTIICAKPPVTHRMITRARDGISKPKPSYVLNVSSAPSVPTGIQIALADPTWKKVMAEEIAALKKNDTWTIIQQDASMNILSSKWVYKLKLDDKGKVIRHKAWLVAVGSKQLT